MYKTSWLSAITFLMLIVVTLSISAGQDQIRAFKDFRTIPLRNSPNEIDINGDGLKVLVFVACRENFNAHGFDIFTFYLQMKNDMPAKDSWHLVPFFNEKGVTEKTSLITEMGADCILSDIRLLRSASNEMTPVVVVVGIRDLGESYIDKASVHFLIYELMHNKQGIAGEPLYYFRHSWTIPAQNKSCDINEAFQNELGPGWYRTDRQKQW